MELFFIDMSRDGDMGSVAGAGQNTDRAEHPAPLCSHQHQ